MSLHFGQVLSPSHVHLRLDATTLAGGVETLLQSLRGDERLTDPEALAAAVRQREFPLIEKDGFRLCLAHGRTNTLRGLVMAAARPITPLLCPKTGEHVDLLFVAGIPAAFNTEYLRLVGAIARICGEPENRQLLLQTDSNSAFVQALEDGLNPL